MTLATDDTILRRVRFQSGDGDALAPRLRLSRAAAPEDWRPSSMPRQSILCVRRMRTSGIPDGGSVRGKLGEALSIAARPIEAPPPASAAAVFFADYAEMLACLALDSLRGRRGEWYWRDLLPGVPPERHWAAVWLRRELSCAAAVTRLLTLPEAEEILAAIPISAAAALEHSILRTFGATEVWPEVRSAFAEMVSVPQRRGQIDFVVREGRVIESTGRRDAEHFMAARFQSLPVRERILAATAAQAVREPRALIGPVFRNWLASALEEHRGVEIARPESVGLASSAIAVPPFVEPITQQTANAAIPVKPRIPSATAGETPLVEETTRAIPPKPEAEIVPDAVAAVIGTSFVEARSQPNEWPSGAPSAAVKPLRFESKFAGVFFLLNAAMHLGYYGDFTMPAFECLPLSPWRFLGLLLEASGLEVEDDPLPDRLSEWAADEEFDKDWLPEAYEKIEQFLGESTAPFCRRLTLAEVCAQAGEIEYSDVEIHATFALDSHPLPLRLAGLDRDPGWIPAAGRDVRFHFS